MERDVQNDLSKVLAERFDDFMWWNPNSTRGLTRTKQEWSKIDPVLIASEGSPAIVRQIVEEAMHDIEMLHNMLSESGRGNET